MGRSTFVRLFWPEGLNLILFAADALGVEALKNRWPCAARSAAADRIMEGRGERVTAEGVVAAWDSALRRLQILAPEFWPGEAGVVDRDALRRDDVDAFGQLFILPDEGLDLEETLGSSGSEVQRQAREWWLTQQKDEFLGGRQVRGFNTIGQAVGDLADATQRDISVDIAWLASDEPVMEPAGDSLILASTRFLLKPSTIAAELRAVLAPT